MNLRIRAANRNDAELLLGIQRDACVAAFPHIFPPEKYPFPDEAVLERWQTALRDPAAEVVVAEVESSPVGLAAARPAWLDGLYVVPECWGTQVATRLHDHAVARLGALGHKRCHLWVLEDNRRARRFYERRGWELDSETPNPIDVRYTRVLVDSAG